jgi:hypothetical protein
MIHELAKIAFLIVVIGIPLATVGGVLFGIGATVARRMSGKTGASSAESA